MSETKHLCRWALLGLSSIAKTFSDDILLPRDESDKISHQVVCVSTTGAEEKAKTWLRERQGLDPENVSIFTSYEEMLESGHFDVVYISTPHPLHYAHVKAAIHYGRHVLVEKPATMNKLQFEELSKLAKTANIVLMEAMWTRYLPAVQHLEQLLPMIGSVKRVYADLSVPIVSKDLAPTSRLLDKQAGAGAMLDMGVYALTWADIAFNGCPATKVVFSSTIPHDTGKDTIDDINTTILHNAQDNGAVAIVTTSMTLSGSAKHSDKLGVQKVAPGVRIEASNAQVSVPFPLIRPQELHVEWYNEENLGADGAERREIIHKPVERGWGLWYQADIIAAAVQSRKQGQKPDVGLVIGGSSTLRVLEWMDAARRMSGITYGDALEAV